MTMPTEDPAIAAGRFSANGAAPKVFAAFDRIRIINLPARKDRRAEMERELEQVGLLHDPRVAFFPAVRTTDPGPFGSPGAHGCFLSHQAIIGEAAEAAESVLILEDDCTFFPAVASYEMPDGWEIFYGGYLAASHPDDPLRGDIIGAHFMAFSASAARVTADYLRDYPGPDFPVDPVAAKEPGYNPAIRPPIDGAYVWLRRKHPELRTEFAMLSGQRPSRTDIGTQRWFDRLPLVRSAAEIARRWRSNRHAA